MPSPELSPDIGLPKAAYGYSNIETLYLPSFRPTRNWIRQVLAAPRRLKTFVHGIAKGAERSVHVVRGALEAQKSSLVNLDLAYAYDWPWTVTHDVPAMSSLRDFISLQFLRVAEDFVLGTYKHSPDVSPHAATQTDALYNMLPVQLEVLHLQLYRSHTSHAIFVSLTRLLELKEHSAGYVLPRLREIALEISKSRARRNFRTLFTLQQRAGAVGIDLKLFWDDSPGTLQVAHLVKAQRGHGWSNDVDFHGQFQRSNGYSNTRTMLIFRGNMIRGVEVSR